MSPNAGGGRGVPGVSQGVQMYTGAHIYFGDLTRYLTYALHHIPSKFPKIRGKLLYSFDLENFNTTLSTNETRH